MSFKFCPECGFKFDKEYKFCPECGYKLTEKEKKPEPLFDFSEDTAKYADDKFGGFDEMLKKQEEKKNGTKKTSSKSPKPKIEQTKEKLKSKAEIKAEAERLYNAEKYAEAFPLCLELAEDGEPLFQLRTGWCYDSGKGVKKDSKKAVFWYEKAAEQGETTSIYNLGQCYYYGRGVKQDFFKAVELYKKAADKHYVFAYLRLSNSYKYSNPEESIKWLEKYCETSNDKLYFVELAQSYDWGRRGMADIPKNETKAFYWYKKAAESGKPDAMRMLGYYYEYGKGTNKDLEKAKFWLKKAADLGDSLAKEWLAKF